MTGQPEKMAIATVFRAQPGSFGSDNDPKPCEDRIADDAADAPQSVDPALLAAIAKAEYGGRRRRDALFGRPLFAEPAWDMLLDLYVQRHRNKAVSIHSLCIAAAVPQTTAFRWIGKLERSGLATRSPCTHDARVIHVQLSEEGIGIMERYLHGQLGATRSPGRPASSFS